MEFKLRTGLSLLLCITVAIANPRYSRASSLSLSTSSFGTSLYKRLASGNQDNIIYSPLSVYTALSMVLLGAGGDTEKELRTTLALQPDHNVHSDIHNLMASMTTNDPAANLTLRLANALYYDAANFSVSDSYATRMSQYYGVGPKPFQRSNPEQAINTWVEEVTDRAITDFLKPGDITSDTVLMLLNAVFFEASWMSTFDSQITQDTDFTTMSGATKQVPLMYQKEYFPVKNVPELDARVLELPYKGGDYSLFIILPNTKTGLIDMESKLTGQTLGLSAMFDALRANLSAMVRDTHGKILVVSDALHDAIIEVDVTPDHQRAATIRIMLSNACVQPSLFVSYVSGRRQSGSPQSSGHFSAGNAVFNPCQGWVAILC